MSENQQHHDDGTPAAPTPQPLPGQVFIRPGIDDRPDYDKALTPEEKAAMGRLAVHQHPKPKPASSERAEVQTAVMNAEAAPVTAAAQLDAAMPNPDSSFMDMRDPMVDAEGHRPGKGETLRLKIGFTVAAVLCAMPFAALNTVIVPERIDRFAAATNAGAGGDGVASAMPLGLLTLWGAVFSFAAVLFVSVFSDRTRTAVGRRAPWIIAGGVVAALFALAMTITNGVFAMIVFWCLVQIGYVMMMTPLAAEFGERIPDKFRDRADAWRGIGLAAGQLLGALFGALIAGESAVGLRVCAVAFLLSGVIAVVALPREHSSEYMPVPRLSSRLFAVQCTPSRHTVKFWMAFGMRLLVSGGAALTSVFEWFIVRHAIAGDSSSLSASAAPSFSAVVTMVIAVLGWFVGSMIAAAALGPVADRARDIRHPAVVALVLYALAALIPWIAPNLVGMLVFALVGGFAYTLFEGVCPRINAAALPDLKSAGRDLAVLNHANALGLAVGALVGAALVSVFGSYLALFPAATVTMLIAGGFVAFLHDMGVSGNQERVTVVSTR